MFSRIRQRLSYANVTATMALFIALGGTSYAAVQLSKGDVKKKHLAKNSVVSKKVKDGSLLSKDFKPGELVAGAPGPQGPQGPAGPQGPKGDTGTVDTSNFYDKAQSDARFLAAGGKAADADKLDGIDSYGVARLAGWVASNGSVSQGSGFTVNKTGTGTYTVSFAAGTFDGCKFPIVSVTPFSPTARHIWVGGAGCSPTGSGSFSVKITGTDGTTATDTSFMFVAM